MDMQTWLTVGGLVLGSGVVTAIVNRSYDMFQLNQNRKNQKEDKAEAKNDKLNTFKGALKVVDALIENREELRDTGTVKLKSTPDKKLVSARKANFKGLK